jgi:hypothetical protein
MRYTKRISFYVSDKTYERGRRYAEGIGLNANELAKGQFLQEVMRFYLKEVAGGRQGGCNEGDAGAGRGHHEPETGC